MADGTTFTAACCVPPTPPTPPGPVVIPKKTGSLTLADPNIGAYAEGLVVDAYTVPTTGIVDITGTAMISITCNSASPSAAIAADVAFFVDGVNKTGWIDITRVNRFSPSAVVTNNQSTAIRYTGHLNAGQHVELKVRTNSIVEKGGDASFKGYTAGMLYKD